MKKTTKKIIASALAAAMVMASSAMTFADTTGEAVSTGDAATTEYEALTKCSYTSEMTVDGKVATVTISVDGDVSAFDFGLMYDAATMEFADWDVTDDFDKAFTKKAGGILAVNDQTEQSYVVAGGTSDECKFTGAALVLSFNIKGEEATPINVVADSKFYLDAMTAAGTTGTLADFVASDAAPEGPAVNPVEVPKADDNTTGDNTTGDNTTGDNTTGDNTTGDNTTGDNTTGTTPATQAPATQAPAAKSPKTGDAGVVLPIVAICGAAAAVAVASKKKVED